MHRIFFTHPTIADNGLYPRSWGKVLDDHCKCVKLSHSSSEFKEVEKTFIQRINHSHPTAQVIDIERVENAKLWRAFSIKKSETIHKNQNIKAENQVKTLYHGAEETAVDAITKTGFDYRRCQVGHYGHGNYFAVNASYSHGYAKPSTSDGSRRIIVCKVVVGESLRVAQKDNTLRRPQDKTTGKMYDSVQGGPTGTEYVVFDNESPYPGYIVIYK
ncbi:predicted protein [Naegleria gruberi]|uniref:Poly [ADP-ribose] polymerase n=1 Tax=Naegleria gruberi TaxID=5762 RepID=D2V175_NAEGR|nr:uncharacterized protein NAEGRDRAFT_30263 [Naegleria gruberi]EFC49258.1 predicted protein [Naegleria gruberi]|eukprot:XP_002682002.1 predicted protein [Naegleria gruberi strain NEG-M]